MQMQPLCLWAFAFVAGVAVLAFSGRASADPPSRVARLGYMTGAVSFSPAGESDWDQATINRPLTTGDRLWADAGALAEIQVGGAMIHMHAGTGVSVLNLDDQITQLQLTQGTLNVRVRRLDPSQMFEVDTPNLAFTLRQPGEYRIEVDPDGYATTIVVRDGQGEVYGEGAAYAIDSRQAYRFTGTGLREYQVVEAPRLDEFDRWSSDRDRRYDNSGSARYVSQDVIGYQDLDDNGTWGNDATYGNVWFPNHVNAGWAPYRDGHWTWVDPWGWTWVDDAPWGFAVSHYGRWTNLRGTWGWVPGPARTRAYYAPALVAFVGGDNFRLTISSGNVGGVAWFPLGPREVYRPSYPVSRGYFENINRSNTVIDNTVINNYYNDSNVTNVVYANRQVPGAVIAVPTTAFVQSQPVSRAAVRVSREMIVNGPVAVAPPVAPTERSVRGAAAQGDKPPPRMFERPVVVRTAPPAAHVGFAAQQRQLTAQPGKPLDDAARRQLKPEAAAPTPVVKLVAPAQIAPPTALPPPVAPGARPGNARGRPDERNVPAAPAISGAPTQGGAPSQTTPPVPAAQPPEQRGQPVAPMPTPPQGAVRPQFAPPQAAPPAPATQLPQQWSVQPMVAPPPQATQPVPGAPSPESRGKSEQRGYGDQRGQPVALPAPPQRAAEPKAVPPQIAPPAPATQLPPQWRAQPMVAPPPQAAPTVPGAQFPAQRAKPEPAPAARQAEPRQPVAAPKPPQPQPVPEAEPRGQEPKPAAGKPIDKKRDSDAQKREEESRKQER